MSPMVVETESFEARPDQVRAVREWVAKTLEPGTRCDDAVLVADELAANAITHTRSGCGGTFEVTIVAEDDVTRIYVIDGGSGRSVPHIRAQRQADAATGGRGLAIVDVLACRWGYEPGHESGMTWCVLAGAS